MNMATMQDTYESLTGRVPITLLASDWVIRSFIDRTPTSGIYRIATRLMDLALGLIGLVGLVILYPIIAVIIRLDSKGPIIFRQIRLGRSGHPYTILKFRTMKDNQDMEKEALVTATNDPRVTRFGRFLRKSHLDEIPQIINVLRGEMSLSDHAVNARSWSAFSKKTCPSIVPVCWSSPVSPVGRKSTRLMLKRSMRLLSNLNTISFTSSTHRS